VTVLDVIECQSGIEKVWRAYNAAGIYKDAIVNGKVIRGVPDVDAVTVACTVDGQMFQFPRVHHRAVATGDAVRCIEISIGIDAYRRMRKVSEPNQVS